MAEIWGAVAAAVVAGGVALYGQNKQSQENRAAQGKNQSNLDQQNNAAWTNWLMTRGIAPTTPVNAGEIPTAGNYTAINTRLPLWANVTMPPTPTPQPSNEPLVVTRKT